MKIKDIVNEGFVSSFAKALLPSALQTAISTSNRVNPPEKELAQSAYEKFGVSPDYDQQKADELLARTTDPARRQKIKDVLGRMSWLKDQQKIKQKAALKQNLRNAPPTPASSPSVVNPLHPDVSVTSSYPLRLRYKNGDFVFDPRSDQWMTVSGKKVAPTMASFLQSQANKL